MKGKKKEEKKGSDELPFPGITKTEGNIVL